MQGHVHRTHKQVPLRAETSLGPRGESRIWSWSPFVCVQVFSVLRPHLLYLELALLELPVVLRILSLSSLPKSLAAAALALDRYTAVPGTRR